MVATVGVVDSILVVGTAYMSSKVKSAKADKFCEGRYNYGEQESLGFNLPDFLSLHSVHQQSVTCCHAVQ